MTTKLPFNPIAVEVSEIVEYWAHRENEAGLSVDWAEAHERCWRCSRKIPLQKCHVIPRSRGGPDVASNLILLCSRCHKEAPNVADPSFIWIWLRRYAVSTYGTDWLNRGFEEFERIFRRKPFAELRDDIPETELSEAVKPFMSQIATHFGEGRPNPSTVAWVLLQAEASLLQKKRQ